MHADRKLSQAFGAANKPVVQLERTGCGIASVAALTGLSYGKAASIAYSLGIQAEDKMLWSGTSYVRRLLRHCGFTVSDRKRASRSWSKLPDLALLSIKWRIEGGRPYWHWVVFVREGHHAYVLESDARLRTNRRTGFGHMRPKWFIAVKNARKLPAART